MEEKKIDKLTIRMTQAMRNKLEELAKKEGRTPSDIARECLQYYIDHEWLFGEG